MPTKEIAPGVLAVTELPKDVSPYIPRWGKTKRLSYKYWSGGMKTGMFRVYHIKLPPGQWSIVGWSDELTEEQCRMIVPIQYFVHAETTPSFKDYTGEWSGFINNAKKSFASLLRSHGITDRALIIKKEK